MMFQFDNCDHHDEELAWALLLLQQLTALRLLQLTPQILAALPFFHMCKLLLAFARGKV
jgi:hypothetical protein